MRPVMGPARNSSGTLSSDAPRFWKIRVAFACGNANPNWIPKAPRQMLQICQAESWGFESTKDVRRRAGRASTSMRSRSTRRGLRELGNAIRDVEPGGFRRHELVCQWMNLRIRIE